MDNTARRPTEEEIDEAERESFPASDPHALQVDARAPGGGDVAPPGDAFRHDKAAARSTKRGCLSIGSPRFWMLVVVLGIATTIGLAWAIALQPTMLAARTASPLPRLGLYHGRDVLWVERGDRVGAIALVAESTRFLHVHSDARPVPIDEIAPPWSRTALLDWATPDVPALSARAIIATGWPTPCLWPSFDREPNEGFGWFRALDGLKIADAPAHPHPLSRVFPFDRVLPMRIARGAFIVDVSFWSVTWGIVLLVPPSLHRSLRGMLRRRRCRCVGTTGAEATRPHSVRSADLGAAAPVDREASNGKRVGV